MSLKRYVLIGAALILFGLCISGVALTSGDTERLIPVHWGIDGAPDRWISRGIAAFVMFPVMIVTYLLGTLAVSQRAKHGELRPWPAVAVVLTLSQFVVIHIVIIADGTRESLVPRPVGVLSGIILFIFGLLVRKPGRYASLSGARGITSSSSQCE